jgi:uncharacterized protein YukE
VPTVAEGGAGAALAARAGLDWPQGEPGEMRDTARSLAAAAGDLGAVAGRIGGVAAADAGWAGLAAGRFDASAAAVGGDLGEAAAGLGRGAAALRHLAETLEDAQRQVTTWARRLVEAEEQAERARALARAAAFDVAATATFGAGDARPDRARVERADRTERAAVRLDAELEDLRRRATEAAVDAGQRVRHADQRCAAEISEQTCRAPRPAIGTATAAAPLAHALVDAAVHGGGSGGSGAGTLGGLVVAQHISDALGRTELTLDLLVAAYVREVAGYRRADGRLVRGYSRYDRRVPGARLLRRQVSAATLRSAADKVGKTAGPVSTAVTAAEQWEADKRLPTGRRVLRTATRTGTEAAIGAAFTAGGAAAGAFVCSPVPVIAPACGVAGGAGGGIAGGVVADKVAEPVMGGVDSTVDRIGDGFRSLLRPRWR